MTDKTTESMGNKDKPDTTAKSAAHTAESADHTAKMASADEVADRARAGIADPVDTTPVEKQTAAELAADLPKGVTGLRDPEVAQRDNPDKPLNMVVDPLHPGNTSDVPRVDLTGGNPVTGIPNHLLEDVADNPVKVALTIALRRVQFLPWLGGDLSKVEASLRAANQLVDWLDSEGLEIKVKASKRPEKNADNSQGRGVGPNVTAAA